MKHLIFAFSRIHPVTIPLIQILGRFRNYTQAANWTATQRKKGSLPYAGSMKNGSGRPTDVFCGWQPKHDNLRHEVKASEFVLWLSIALSEFGQSATFRRGYNVSGFREDIGMDLNGHSYFIEIDCSSMTRRQVQRRWNRYRRFDPGQGTVVIIAAGNHEITSSDRMKELLRWSESVYGIAVFTTHELVCASPLGLTLWDAEHGRMGMLNVPVKG